MERAMKFDSYTLFIAEILQKVEYVRSSEFSYYSKLSYVDRFNAFFNYFSRRVDQDWYIEIASNYAWGGRFTPEDIESTVVLPEYGKNIPDKLENEATEFLRDDNKQLNLFILAIAETVKII